MSDTTTASLEERDMKEGTPAKKVSILSDVMSKPQKNQ